MATSNPFNFNVPAARSPRNAFSTSYSTLFTSPAGMILPAYVENVKSGDKVKLSLSSITRTRPVNTAAFQSFDEKIDFWYVPTRLLWSDYNNWLLSENTRKTSLGVSDIGSQNMLPTTTWASIGSWFRNNSDAVVFDVLNGNSISYALRLLDLLGYSVPASSAISFSQDDLLVFSGNVNTPVDNLANFYSFFDDARFGSPFNYFRLAAFQCIYMHHYRNEEFEPYDPTYFNCDNVFLGSNPGEYLKPDNSAPDVDDGCSSVHYLSATLDGRGHLGPSSTDPYITLGKLFAPRYKNWRKDLFTSLKPLLKVPNGLSFNSGQGGFGLNTPGDINNTDPFVPNHTPGDGYVPNSHNDPSTQRSGEFDYLTTPYFPYQNLWTQITTASSQNGALYGSARLTPQQIYNVLALDKFARRSLYADKNYKEQMKVLFGVEVSESDVPRYLGSHSSSISINEVVASSAGEASFGVESSKSVLGEIAGKGYQSSNGFVFDDTFNEDGIIIGMHYIMPRNNYDSYRVNKFNLLSSRFDYYFPDFDGLGYQPVFSGLLNLRDPGGSFGTYQAGTKLLGYAPRYFEYKDRQNEVHGTFMTGQVDSNWTVVNNSQAVEYSADPYNFKILPMITDSIFTLKYDGSQMTDPFMCCYSFDVTRVSNLEVQGVPNF